VVSRDDHAADELVRAATKQDSPSITSSMGHRTIEIGDRLQGAIGLVVIAWTLMKLLSMWKGSA